MAVQPVVKRWRHAHGRHEQVAGEQHRGERLLHHSRASLEQPAAFVKFVLPSSLRVLHSVRDFELRRFAHLESDKFRSKF
jgi:hypothetical protein